jgi:hypothetical protein
MRWIDKRKVLDLEGLLNEGLFRFCACDVIVLVPCELSSCYAHATTTTN